MDHLLAGLLALIRLSVESNGGLATRQQKPQFKLVCDCPYKLERPLESQESEVTNAREGECHGQEKRL
jgi:hypothetical protein